MKIIVGIILGWVIAFLAVYVYFSTGRAPIAVTSPPMPFETKFAKMDLHAHVDREAPKTNPFTPTEADYLAGAQIYRNDCAVCHSLPNQTRTAIAKGEFPRPPQLLMGKGVTDDPAGETYYKVDNGIRMTGMPGFHNSLTEKEMWQVSMMLADADKVPQSVKDLLNKPLPTEVTTSGSGPLPASGPPTKK